MINKQIELKEEGVTFDVNFGAAEGVQAGYKEGYKDGEAEGHTEGYQEGYDKGQTEGYAKGEADGHAAGYQEGYDKGEAAGTAAGRTAEWNDFWDAFQKQGTRGSYANAFVGDWTDEIFKPKYDIALADSLYSADSTFYQSEISDLAGCLSKQGVKLDLSKVQRLSGTFQASKISNMPPIDLSNCTKILLGLYNMTELKSLTIQNLRADCTFDRALSYNHALESLNISGTIGSSGFNLQHATKLSKESWQNVVSCLSATTTGLSITGSLTSVKKAFETAPGANDGNTSDEWLALIATKPNWTISLA